MEKCLRPGIESCYLLHTWIKFYSNDFISSFGCLNRRISQACSCVQNASHDWRDSCDLSQRVLHRVNVFDAMHHEASNEHAWCSPRRHQATDTICTFREHLYWFDSIIFQDEAVNLRFADLFNAMPVKVFTIGERN